MTIFDQIAERERKATEGPWTNDYDDDGCLIDNKGTRIALTNDRDFASFDVSLRVCVFNAELICFYRNHAVPELARRLKAAIELLRNEAHISDKYIMMLEKPIEEGK